MQLERDFYDSDALEDYILTPAMADAFARVADGLRHGSGRRAWRITGDFGVGKSFFALVLAHLVQGERASARIAGMLGWPEALGGRLPTMWPILLTGSRENIVAALSRGIGDAVRANKARLGARISAGLMEEAKRVEATGRAGDLEQLIDTLRERANQRGLGVLMIIDEMGKLLEHAAMSADKGDVFVFQRLAETAARSAERPFMLLGLLHQSFHAYAERLPTITRHEWEKVAGRFEELVFDQPLMHTAALVAGALNVETSRLPRPMRDSARATAAAAAETGWLGGGTTFTAAVDASRLYPLHPTLLPVMIRFFTRFGQHERSLFGLLLSSEPFGLQAFAERPAATTTWYRLSDFFDYIRAVFGHRLSGASYRSQWLRIVATVEAAYGRSDAEIAILKTVAVLNLIEADDLLPTARALKASLAPRDASETGRLLHVLERDNLIFRRGAGGAFRLWPQSSANLEARLAEAGRSLGNMTIVGSSLRDHLDSGPILARRHYIESGTMRYFEVRYALPGRLAETLSSSTEADGVLAVLLPDFESEYASALVEAAQAPLRDRNDILVAVAQPLFGLAPELREVQLWKWIQLNTPELIDDAYAGAEISRQLIGAQRALSAALSARLGFRTGQTTMEWFKAGRRIALPKGGATAMVSRMCDEIFTCAPLIRNELLNRNTLSSAASAARMRLVEGMFKAPDQPLLGINARKAPPEKSMYLSVMERGRLHAIVDGKYRLVEPSEDDPLRLRPAIDRLVRLISDARGDRLSVMRLFADIGAKPYGVRSGVGPLLLAIVLCTRSHEIAVYEHGTFLHNFAATDFMRLVKSPDAFEIQHCRIEGIRAEVFSKLADAFAATSRKADLLDVVKPLCRFAAQLPEATRRTAALGPQAAAVRDTLLAAREPSTMIFNALPEACGVAAFLPDQKEDDGRVHEFVDLMRIAVDELRTAYPLLLQRVISHTSLAVGDGEGQFDRQRLAYRAARVSLAAREPRLRTFALRLRDPGLSDEAWAEALASFIVSKPPSRWTAADEARFAEDIGQLGELFHRVEATAFFGSSIQPTVNAVRVNLTRGDGADLLRVVEVPDGGDVLEAEAALLRKRMPKERRFRLQLLTQLLWHELLPLDEQTSKGQTHLNLRRRSH